MTSTSTPLVTKPPDPTMGLYEETFPSSGVWNCRVGGKPFVDWSGLDTSQAIQTTTKHYRPINPLNDSKAYELRTKGLQTKFSKSSDITNFQHAVWDHLTANGLDTIAYLPNPSDPTNEVLDMVNNHSRYSIDLEGARKLSSNLRTKFDTMDNANDAAARTFVMNSLEDTLFEDIRDKSKSSDTFASTWLVFIHHIITTSVTRFDNLKKKISATVPSQFACQDIEGMSKVVKRLGKEVKSAGHFQHSLTLNVVKKN